MVNYKKHKTPIIIIVAIVTFVGSVCFNYLKAQKDIRDTKPAPLSIEFISYPEKLKVGSTATFIWKVDSSPDLSTSLTTIYWGYESTPSALTVLDTPEAVKYAHSQPDYANGIFALPDTFSENINFNRVGRVYFRAYAKVKNDNLWSEEKYFEVAP